MTREPGASVEEDAGPRVPRPRLERRGARRSLAMLAVIAVALGLAMVAAIEGDLPEDLTIVGAFVAGVLKRFGVPASLALLYLEESGGPLPVPGDIYVVYLGTIAAGSPPKLAAVWLAIIAVVVAGSSNLYLVSRRWGHRLLTGRLGR